MRGSLAVVLWCTSLNGCSYFLTYRLWHDSPESQARTVIDTADVADVPLRTSGEGPGQDPLLALQVPQSALSGSWRATLLPAGPEPPAAEARAWMLLRDTREPALVALLVRGEALLAARSGTVSVRRNLVGGRGGAAFQAELQIGGPVPEAAMVTALTAEDLPARLPAAAAGLPPAGAATPIVDRILAEKPWRRWAGLRAGPSRTVACFDVTGRQVVALSTLEELVRSAPSRGSWNALAGLQVLASLPDAEPGAPAYVLMPASAVFLAQYVDFRRERGGWAWEHQSGWILECLTELPAQLPLDPRPAALAELTLHLETRRRERRGSFGRTAGRVLLTPFTVVVDAVVVATVGAIVGGLTYLDIVSDDEECPADRR